ncbi:hypothetical protein [Actomonas aquatica]|uniref:Uncharacterized protein n=1 Tax=Actomonas aquatica TaxID=2866162 RepID=A0ABZ1CDE1_9BACT|nr:hypothetical protein [Opitutus sp. WL0086]WRQ89390.1 hypothetical protein K1X11_008210 [Opitutus sp. WL0086]
MSAADTLPAKSSNPSIRRVTDIREIIHAGAVESVIMADGKVAMRFGTREGIVVVICPLDSYVAVARASRDYHGRAFPGGDSSARAEARSIYRDDAAASMPKQEPAPAVESVRPLVAAGARVPVSFYAEVMEALEADDDLTITTAAQRHGMKVARVSLALRKHFAERLQAWKHRHYVLRRIAAGKPVSDAQRAEAGLSIPKPAEQV